MYNTTLRKHIHKHFTHIHKHFTHTYTTLRTYSTQTLFTAKMVTVQLFLWQLLDTQFMSGNADSYEKGKELSIKDCFMPLWLSETSSEVENKGHPVILKKH